MLDLKSLIIKFIGKLLSTLLPPRIMKCKRLFGIWEAKGYHVTPVHFYEPIPDTRAFAPDLFTQESTLPGIDLNEQAQISLLHQFSSNYRDEYSKFAYDQAKRKNEFFFENGAFETVDAEILYCMIRHFKPKHIIEIGSGFSTLVTATAIRQNTADSHEYQCELTCVEPYPKEWISEIPEVSQIVQSKVEKVPLETFSKLQHNDILFIDSSHIINIYNDVCFEYLEVLPGLNDGVLVHIHDIILPQRYCEYWLDSKYFWNEQYLLQAFMACNTSFQILWAGNFMHLRHPNELAQAFPSYSRFKKSIDKKKQLQGHKSFWIQRLQQ